MVADITTTVGGVVFTGDLDGNVLAYDAQSGEGVLKERDPQGDQQWRDFVRRRGVWL